MRFRVNGKERTVPHALSIGAYLRELGVNPLAVAVECDGAIVAREAFDATDITEGARLEIVRMMGGGAEGGPYNRATLSGVCS
ncbi:MAG: sulfur carrier protein ThiS [Chloroflexi bacterium]|nr:sulfur carrier protein ThiS [Chloroflexota bacterium]